MPTKKPTPKKKPPSRQKFVKVEGTFEELIAKSVGTPKPKGAGLKPGK